MRPADDSGKNQTEGDPNVETSPDDIAQLRQQLRDRIDAIDDEIAGLILKRIELSNQIMKTKSPSRITDPAREQAIIERYSEKLSDVSTPAKSKRLVLGVIGASKLYPEI